MNRPFETRDGDGVLFRNDEKKGDNSPDYRGSIQIQGQAYWLSAWIKSSKAGAKYMSLAAKPKTAQAATPNPPAQHEFDDEIPF